MRKSKIIMSLFNSTEKLFLIYGFSNFLITNIFLQIALLITPVFFATVFSQFINISIGYYLYGKKVFKCKSLNNNVFKKYLSLALIMWSLNFVLIQIFFYKGINKNLAAILIIPLLVMISYFVQKKYVFK